jgi:ATP-dependent helicase/DNAse subunit B
MPASVHLVCGPAGSDTTRRLLARYRAATRSDPGAALWLGPTHRSVETLRERLLDEGACLAPQLFPFQDFVEELIRVNDPGARPLSNVQRRLLADNLVAELHARKELSHFERVIETRGFAEGVFSLLAELKRHEIWPAQLARAAYRRGYRGSQVGREINGRAISRKDRQCARIYARYQQRLIRHHLYDLEGRFWYARDLLARGLRRPFGAVRAVFVDGFTTFTRTQHDILAALCQWIEELWLTLPDEPGDERGELFTGPRTTRHKLEPLRPHVEFHSCPADGKPAPRPTGLVHLEGQLFRPLRLTVPSANADGLLCLEAPGTLGETRMVARQIKTLLLEGTPAEDIVVTLRDVQPYADLVREVFAEYGIPVDIEGTESLLRNPAVATLLRAMRLPDDDWPFPAVTALLRSTYFAPDWPEVRADPEAAQHAEVLLRLLGEPRGRAAYLAAVHRWVERPQPGLEDEQAEESRRQRIHQLAQRCQPFLVRFFQTWDKAPAQGALVDLTAWLRVLAEDLGIVRTAAGSPRDGAVLRRWWEELEEWTRLEQRLRGTAQTFTRAQFLRMLNALAAEAGLARTPRGPGRVRVLSAALARGLEAPVVLVMGLGERSFPQLTAPEPFFDEPERQSFRQAGLDFLCVGDLMPDEMLLFYQVVTRARRQLVLSYPAVDEKGQALLPSSFLTAILACFRPGAVRVERRQMLIDRYEKDPPLCPPEHRVQVASALAAGAGGAAGLPADLAANLSAAATMIRLRQHAPEFNPYDGMLRHPAAIATVGQMFGPGRIFSPTALEDYVTCPFRFFLRHVLRLEPLEEPSEDIEVTRRGQAFHRALARLHTQLQSLGITQPTEAVDEQVQFQLGQAIKEYVDRAPSPASKKLWELEGHRLRRSAARYRSHWTEFVEPWRERQVEPQPYRFEVDFGLPTGEGSAPTKPLIIRSDDVEVHISGRIDRVDTAPLPDGIGFWIIDYKTGRGSHYTSTDLSDFRRLQLTLYALAVEEVLLAGQQARPLGLAYWLVTDVGPKIVLPARGQVVWLDETNRWRQIRERLQAWVVTLVANIRQGRFPLKPRDQDCTATCDFAQICRITQGRLADKSWELALPGGE